MHERHWTQITNGPFARRIVATGGVLTLFLAVLAPESSAPLGFVQRFVFWALHIGLGLGAAIAAALMLVRWLPDLRDWRLVVLSGMAGVVLFAPMAFCIELLFPVAESPPDNDWADRLARTSPWATILVEAIEMAPSYLAAWALINLGSFTEALNSLALSPEEPVAAADLPERDLTNQPESPVSERPASQASPDHEASAHSNAFLDRLPPAIGRDVVAVSSDLHYLQVVTRGGQAMVLGALNEVEKVFGDAGLRVHRSHWVHLDAVTRLNKAGSGWQLEMAGGARFPISRRKRAAVVERLGEDFVRTVSTV